MQDHPGAPGTARQGTTRTIVSTNRGGKATQPRAPGHERPLAASSGAAGHGRLSAATRAPGADVPPATTAGAPGQHRLSAAPRAPGHGRPLANTAGTPCRDRLSAVPPAPDRDRSRARHTMAPGHGRPLAALSAARHDRPCATLMAPGADVPPATTAGVPGQHRLSAMAIATAPVPAGLRRLRQGVLPRTPATPNTLTYPHSHRDTAQNRESGKPRPPVTTGGAPGGYAPKTQAAYSQTPTRLLAHNTTHQVHPAIQVPPRPRSCSTACTGFLRQHPSRAPPDPCPSLRRKPQTSRTNE